ncbi:hypothetical protein C1A50_0798 [Paenibacillus polymyxa]|nr:hypothetical protein C1A50_0798 [Paenibacillus polymyxa]
MISALWIYVKMTVLSQFFYYAYEKGDITYARSFLSIK